MLVLTDGTPGVEAIRDELAGEGVPDDVVNLRAASRPAITRGFLTRPGAGGVKGGNFAGIVLPGTTPKGLTNAELSALARYERKFGVRQVNAYSPPQPAIGMSAPVYSGKLSGAVTVTAAGTRAGFGYLNGSFPFSGGAAGPAPFGYLAEPVAGSGATAVTPLLDAAIPHTGGSATLVWQFTRQGTEQLGIGFGASQFMAQFRYLAHGIVSWVTSGVQLGYWRNFLTIDYDDVINADAQWSEKGHCTPGAGICPKGTPNTAAIRMKPADVTFAVRWQRQHHFEMEFLYNGGSSARFQVHGTDPLLAAFKPVADEFYWINHTYTHANLGCKQDFSVDPWRCVRSGGHIVWASEALITSQIQDNLTWARRHGIPNVYGVVATGEYSGLKILPQQRVDNPNLIAATFANHVKWIPLDASREPDMRPVGAALGIPRHPIDVGYDVDDVGEEVNEYNWFHTSKKDGGSGLCEHSKVTACIKPLSPRSGWTSHIVPEQVQNVFLDALDNDPRPFFMHQSNLTGDRLGYDVMDGVLSAYRAVYNPGTPVVNRSMAGDGVGLRAQQLWTAALAKRSVTAWVNGRTVTVSGPPGTMVPVTVPPGTRSGSPGGAVFGEAYGAQRSAYVTLGSAPLKLRLPAAPFRQP
ncbi:MAG TPA: hypothetical protein VFX25_39065 [Streptosporangiaceae bacterium]|nr:hypothetical protein [Streptosporangiaceae bacterium]